MSYLKGRRFVFNDECSSFSPEEVLPGLGFPKELMEKGKVRKAFDAVNEEVRDLIHPAAAAAYFNMPDKTIPPVPTGTEVVGAIITLGADITRRSDEYFAQGEYTKGMILNEMADHCLLNYEKIIKERLEVLSDRKGMTLGRLYEAPEDMPISEIKYVCKAVGSVQTIGVDVSKDSVFFPIKSSCIILVVKDK